MLLVVVGDFATFDIVDWRLGRACLCAVFEVVVDADYLVGQMSFHPVAD